MYSSQRALHTMSRRTGSRNDLTGASYPYARSEVLQSGNGYGQEYTEVYTFSRGSLGGGQMSSSTSNLHQRAAFLHEQCQDYLQKAEHILQGGGDTPHAAAEAERCMVTSREFIEQLKILAFDLRQMGQPNDNVLRSMEQCQEQLRGLHMALGGSLQRKRSSRGSFSWEEQSRSFAEAFGWITQQKRLIETSPWGDDPASIEQQILSHNKYQSQIQRSTEVDRAREELIQRGDKANLHALDQEWDSLQKLSFARSSQLRELQGIIEEISREIMWVNDREEEELVFDWGNKNIDVYIPQKQESYSRLMSELEQKERDLNKLKLKVDSLLKNNHPASDKIEAYMDTLQTQWSWLLQITKCIHVHLKENAAYSQFFKEANEIYSKLQKDHEGIRKKFICDKSTSLQNLLELSKALEREREKLTEHKQQVQQLVNKSKEIVRLRPRNPEEKSNSPVIVRALCEFKQDQKVICKGDEAILKDNSERSKWLVTGPGGLDMEVPSVCLLVPPPNPLSISVAGKNEQYFEAIMSVWNQLFINIRSLISWQYCIQDINHINSLTITMLSRMRPEEYRSIIKSLETHYQEFQRHCLGSEMFEDDDKRNIETQYQGAQKHYEQLVIQLPAYNSASSKTKTTVTASSTLLSELHVLRLKLEGAESALTTHLHLPLGEDAPAECAQHITQTQAVHRDIISIREQFVSLRERVLRELEGMTDVDKAQFLRSQLDIIDKKLSHLDTCATAYSQRLKAVCSLLQAELQAEDVVKVFEARLTERDTTTLDPEEVQEYQNALKSMRSELEQKQSILSSLNTELSKACQYNDQMERNCHRCDVDLTQHAERVGQLSDRWGRIQTQIDSRLRDLDSYLVQLQRYLRSSSVLSEWINETRQRLDAQQATKTDDIAVLMEHLSKQKALNTEIKGKREDVETVQRDGDTCVSAIKDYELELASYSAGLETLLNIPIKRTMLQSPSTAVIQEVSDLHARYIELQTRSSDYYKFLTVSLKNMEELKMRGTRIDLLEEELRRLREEIQDHTAKNASLKEALSQYQLQLSESQQHLLSLEEVKRSQALQCSAARDSLDSSQTQLKDLTAQIQHLQLLLEEEERRRKIAEERYASQQDEYEATMRRRQKELDEANFTKIELDKMVSDRARDAERLRRQLEEAEQRVKETQTELAKVRQQHSVEMREVKETYESQILITQTSMQRLSMQREEDSSSLRQQSEKLEAECRDLQEELRRLRVSLKEEEAHRRRIEEEAQLQSSVVTEEARRRRELESHVQLLLSQKNEEENRSKQTQESSTRVLQEKNSEINRLTHALEEELRRRRALEAETEGLEQALAELRAKLTSSSQELVQLRSTQQELSLLRVELETQGTEKGRAEQTIARLQARVQELQQELERLEGELEHQGRVAQEEAAKRRRTETQLEKSSQAMREYTSTINTLRKSLEETSSGTRAAEEEIRQLQEALDRSRKEHSAVSQRLATLESETKTLRLQLTQEQGRVREANQRYETLHRSMEEKTRALNESIAEANRLKSLTQELTKERLHLEEELRTARQERDEIQSSRQQGDEEAAAQISALQQQLQDSQRTTAEHDGLIKQLSQEREKLRLEIQKIQKQTSETSSTIQTYQSQCSELQQERDALMKKIKAMEQDLARLQKLQEELTSIKLSLESELRLKQRLQEENEKIRKESGQWRSQYESQESHVRQLDSDRSRLERERDTLRYELEQLQLKLKEIDQRYKLQLQSMQQEYTELKALRDSLQQELLSLQQQPDTCSRFTQTETTVDPSTLVFEGVRKTVTAQQLRDCGVINQVTFDQLLNGKRSVPEVAVDIRLSLKGTGVIAGVATGPQGRMPITEAKRENILSEDVAVMLLEAQAATGHIIDPRANVRMTVDEACSCGMVDDKDKERLLVAEAACVGFRDPSTAKPLSVGQAMRKGLIDQGTTLRLLQAQEAVGGMLDPVLSVYLPKDVAMDRDLIDDVLYQALNGKPECYIDPGTHLGASYVTLKKQCKTDPTTGLLLLPAPEKPMMVQGLRDKVPVTDLVDAKLLERSDLEQLKEGKLTSQDIEHRLRAYLRGSTCIAGVFDEANDRTLPIYQAMKDGLLRPGTTMELLEAQAASGFMIDPVNNQYLTVEEACKKGLVGIEFKDKLVSAERAVTGYKDPGTEKVISLFQAIERGLIEKGHGIRLLEAQIASGGIIDPKQSHRIDVDVAYQRGYFGKEMNQILKDEGDDTKGFFDPNTQENLTYLQLKGRCITDKETGLVLLPLYDKRKQAQQQTQKNTLRKRRVVIVDPDTNKEMTVHEAYERQLIDYETYMELSQQECEWEEITITTSDGSTRLVIVDRKTGIQYDLQQLLEKGVIDQDTLQRYSSKALTLTEFADIITSKSKPQTQPLSSHTPSSTTSFSSQTSVKTEKVTTVGSTPPQQTPPSPNTLKHIASVSITLAAPKDTTDEQSPVGAVFHIETMEKISVFEALRRGIVDSITAQRLLEAQACTGGIVNPENGRRVSIQEATRLGILDNEMANRLKASQKAYIGFEDVKSKRRMSAAEAVKEKWLPYEAGQRFLEFQFLTGGLFDPEHGCRRTLEEAVRLGWLDGRAAQKLQDTKHHPKTLTCPKTKLRISYREALQGSMVEEKTGIRMLPGATTSSCGISSPYNSSSAPGSASGSRTGSRRGSVDLTFSSSSLSRYSSFSYNRTSFSSSSLS
ncbi:LOW QUALITY PROTEIN: desmoplakin-B [Chanos chanos]|uniref:LOW QUALITY PROTEIN: desmoplakin-B n=1 Tax=Chanos chanos TaxID=29144 RepID=A0A6J2V2P0_CHACN|nr:LOW QUALITY PROTEIN: desmoplakin-like [Chanos chanos]